MKKKYRFLALILFPVLLLTGCGDSLYEMTEEEQEIITTYSAYAVALHNTFQKDGLVTVDPRLLEQDVVTPPVGDETQNDTQQASSGNGGNGQGGQNGQEAATEAVEPTTTFAKVLGHENDLKVVYKGYDISKNYQEGKAYSVSPPEGTVFLVAKIKIKNTSGSDIKLDNTSLDLGFRCCYDGTNTVGSEASFLSKDFCTYEGTVKAGKSLNTVLFFPIPKKDKKNVKNLSISVVVDGQETKVKI